MIFISITKTINESKILSKKVYFYKKLKEALKRKVVDFVAQKFKKEKKTTN